MYDPRLFSRPSRYMGEAYIPDSLHDYKEPSISSELRGRVAPFPRAGLSYNKVALALVLGICGITVLGLCAPFAWMFGATALREMDEEGFHGNAERILAQVGLYLGIIGTLLLLLRVVPYILAIINK